MIASDTRLPWAPGAIGLIIDEHEGPRIAVTTRCTKGTWRLLGTTHEDSTPYVLAYPTDAVMPLPEPIRRAVEALLPAYADGAVKRPMEDDDDA